MKATLLTFNEIFGKNKLDIIKEMGSMAKTTDFGIATGVRAENLETRFAPYYLMESHAGFLRAMYYYFGYEVYFDGIFRHVGVRPVIKFESIDEIYLYGGELLPGNKLKFGVYADNALLKDEQNEWTNALSNGTLIACGKYTLDSRKYNDYRLSYSPIEYLIYEYNVKKAIRIKVNSSFDGKTFKLSNGELYKDGDYVWFDEKDKIWHFDEKNLMAISEEIILGGIQFGEQFNEADNRYEEEDFPNINIGRYLNSVFLPELMQFQKTTLDNSNLNTILKKVYKQQEYIKILEKENQEYKKETQRYKDEFEKIGMNVDTILASANETSKILGLKPHN